MRVVNLDDIFFSSACDAESADGLSIAIQGLRYTDQSTVQYVKQCSKYSNVQNSNGQLVEVRTIKCNVVQCSHARYSKVRYSNAYSLMVVAKCTKA